MKSNKKAGFISGEQRTSIRMSKLARTLQTDAARANWSEMVKLLFRADPQQGRQEELRRLLSPPYLLHGDDSGASFSPDQFHYILVLMLIISIAETRTQELYGKQFLERCDAISRDHELQDDQYWTDGKAPLEWEKLNQEFERTSIEILQDTLREYHQDEIADLVEAGGADQLFEIIKSIRSQFYKILEESAPAAEEETNSTNDSIPETLQPSVASSKS